MSNRWKFGRTQYIYPPCKEKGHDWELRADSVDAVFQGRYDVLCCRCICEGTHDDLRYNVTMPWNNVR